MMKSFSKLAVMIGLSVLFIMPAIVNADGPKSLKDYADKHVKSTIEAEFNNFRPSLEVAKKDFNLAGNESFDSAQLGDGVPYWQLNGEIEPQFEGYVFPILVGSKEAAIVFTQQENGEWRIFNISNHNTFTTDVSEGAKQLGKSDAAKLIYDQQTGLYALTVESVSGERSLLPLRDDEAKQLYKSKKVSFEKYKQEVIKRKEQYRSQQNVSDGDVIISGARGTVVQ